MNETERRVLLCLGEAVVRIAACLVVNEDGHAKEYGSFERLETAVAELKAECEHRGEL